MIPIPALDGQSLGRSIVTLLLALAPALLAWWNDRRLIARADDPALAELLASRRRLNVRAIVIALALMFVFGGGAAAWGIPLLLVFLIAAGYPLRTRLFGETWGFGAYLWHTAASIIGGFGFWIALAYTPTLMQSVGAWVGEERWWLAAAVGLVVIAVLVAWEAWYPRIWLRAHAARPLADPELTPRFDEIVRRAATIVPAVYRVGPQGSRFVNAVALPSVKRPSVAIGNALLEILEPDETAAIFAHEVAHFDHFTPRRVRRIQLVNRALIVTGVALPIIAALAHLTSASLIAWFWPVFVLLAVGRRAAKSQQHETESDLRAAALCGDPEAMVRALVKLHVHARIPRRYAVDTERAATHPSLVRRIQAIRAGGQAAIEQLGTATIVKSTREGSWVVLDDARSYWLDGVPAGTDATLSTLRDAASSYRAVNYRDLVELHVTAGGDARSIAVRTRGGDHWNVPLAPDDVARVQRALDVVDLRLGKAAPAPTRATPKIIALAAFTLTMIAGQAGILLVPVAIAMWKPSASALAALGAMSIVRVVFGVLEGSSWFDENILWIGLVGLLVCGVAAIYTAVRLVRAGEGKANLRLTLALLAGVAVLAVVAMVARFSRMPSQPIVGAPLVGTVATALFGIAAALFTVQARWGRPAAYAGLVLAAALATVGVDRRSVILRRALTEDKSVARATLVSSTELGGMAQRLRVSPGGGRFLATRLPTGPGRMASRPTLVIGSVSGSIQDLAAVDGDFVDENRVLLLGAIDDGAELRLETVDGAATPIWADTLSDFDATNSRLSVDREAGSWTLITTVPDSDQTVVLVGRIGEKVLPRRIAVPDTIPMTGDPIVFDEGATAIVPSYPDQLNTLGDGASLWMLPFTGFQMPSMRLWRIHGDSVRLLGPMDGGAQCGAAVGGVAACAGHRMNATSLYTVRSTGEVVEVARLSEGTLRMVTMGPGLRGASMTFDNQIVSVDLGTKRLARIALPPTSFASEVRLGPGWAITLGYGQNQRSVVRVYSVR
jgi:Zn-dependent protease with chaperone function